MLVSKEQIFSVPADSFAVSPSAEGYTLYYGVNAQFTAYTASTPANEVLVVKGIPKGMSFKLVGNNSDVFIQY